MACLVVLPDSVVIQVQVDSKAEGQEVLDKVCQKLGIIETDYFGLQYEGTKGEALWLNMRNRLARQFDTPEPYRLQFLVKFCVLPHYLLQETTRHWFYMHMKKEFQEDRLHVSDDETVIKLCGLFAQAELGDFTHNASQLVQYSLILPKTYSTPEYTKQIAECHLSFNGVSKNSAEYRVLQELSQLESYGVEFHCVKSPEGQTVNMGVGPEGVFIYDQDWTLVQKIKYITIDLTTHSNRNLVLNILQEDTSTVQEYRLVSDKAAQGLYRCITEMHSFFRCDTVRNVVSSQFSRDLKGTLASLFNENTSLGKKYVFDIRRTCREAYDHARRVLYAAKDALPTPPTVEQEEEEDMVTEESEKDTPQTPCIEQQCKALQEKLDHIREAFLCRVCMDAEADTVFCPCGHLACCGKCTQHVDICPLCRQEIQTVQRIYFPVGKLAMIN